jgi:thiol-disulfide isomerase/thioredoxin
MKRVAWVWLLAASFALVGTACGADSEGDDAGNNDAANNAAVNNDAVNNDAANNDAANNDAANNDAVNNDAANNDAANNDAEPADPWEGCEYPESAVRIPTEGEVMPWMTWKNTHNWDGSTFEFNLRDYYCNPAYESTPTLVFMATAGWCPACPEHARALQALSEDFREAGALMIWMEVEDESSLPASSEQAHELIKRYLGAYGFGYRVGDASTEPKMMFNGNPMIQAFPTHFVVRREDMRIIATSNNSQFTFPSLQVARYPDADWSDPRNNTLGTNVGDACVNDGDCDTGTLIPFCVTDIEWPQGYCLAVDCADDAACGDGGLCLQDQNGVGLCYKGCESDSECRAGYSCSPVSGLGGPSACVPQ